jgi:hypothetical protein
MNKQLMFEFVSHIIDEMSVNVSAQLPGIESPAKSASYFKSYTEEREDEENDALDDIKQYLSPDE